MRPENECIIYVSMAREIMHMVTQSAHKYVWQVKWDQGQRNGWLGRSNSHPLDHESCLMSQLPTCWHVCILQHCTMDLDVAFLYDDFNPAWMHKRQVFWEKLKEHRMSDELGWGTPRKLLQEKGIFFSNLAVHLLVRRNWFHIFM